MACFLGITKALQTQKAYEGLIGEMAPVAYKRDFSDCHHEEYLAGKEELRKEMGGGVSLKTGKTPVAKNYI